MHTEPCLLNILNIFYNFFFFSLHKFWYKQIQQCQIEIMKTLVRKIPESVQLHGHVQFINVAFKSDNISMLSIV